MKNFFSKQKNKNLTMNGFVRVLEKKVEFNLREAFKVFVKDILSFRKKKISFKILFNSLKHLISNKKRSTFNEIHKFQPVLVARVYIKHLN